MIADNSFMIDVMAKEPRAVGKARELETCVHEGPGFAVAVVFLVVEGFEGGRVYAEGCGATLHGRGTGRFPRSESSPGT